ncbi:MAG: PhoU domain-containing protein [Candidatus Undinarchaeales archaeon]
MGEETYEVDEIVEELVEKGKGVKELLREMKNVSELMVDLAYSAVLFNNDELAEEVKELEEEMNKLRYQIEIRTMVAARDPEDAGKLEGILRISAAAENISNAAENMADIVLRDIGLHPVVRDALKEADEIVDRVIVKKSSKLAEKTVEDLRKNAKYGMDVISIKRGKNWIFKVKDSEEIKGGDTLIVSGFKENVRALQKTKE